MLEKARPEDVPLIQSILDAPENLTKLEGYADAVLRDAISDPAQPVFVWRTTGQAVGFAWFRRNGAAVKLEEFGVLHPGSGIGARFFAALIAELAGADPLWLYVAADNAGAIRFYQRFGFSSSPENKLWHRREGPPIAALRMERILEN